MKLRPSQYYGTIASTADNAFLSVKDQMDNSSFE